MVRSRVVQEPTQATAVAQVRRLHASGPNADLALGTPVSPRLAQYRIGDDGREMNVEVDLTSGLRSRRLGREPHYCQRPFGEIAATDVTRDVDSDVTDMLGA